MKIESGNIKKGKPYWIVDKSAPLGRELFEYYFHLDEDPLIHWNWAVFETRAEAEAYKKTLALAV